MLLGRSGLILFSEVREEKASGLKGENKMFDFETVIRILKELDVRASKKATNEYSGRLYHEQMETLSTAKSSKPFECVVRCLLAGPTTTKADLRARAAEKIDASVKMGHKYVRYEIKTGGGILYTLKRGEEPTERDPERVFPKVQYVVYHACANAIEDTENETALDKLLDETVVLSREAFIELLSQCGGAKGFQGATKYCMNSKSARAAKRPDAVQFQPIAKERFAKMIREGIDNGELDTLRTHLQDIGRGI